MIKFFAGRRLGNRHRLRRTGSSGRGGDKKTAKTPTADFAGGFVLAFLRVAADEIAV